jgi:hypothetical protein
MKFLSLLFLFFLVACSRPERIDSYYFPVSDYFIAKTDCFQNQNDPNDKICWEMRTFVAGFDTFMQTTISDKNGWLDDITERISNGVVSIRSYTIFDYDENQRHVRCETKVIDSISFNADQQKEEPVVFKLRYFHPLQHDTCEFTRTRTLVNVTENQVTFSDILLVEFDNSSSGYEYKATQIYEKGKGLVAYKMHLPGGETRDYRKVSQ